MSEDHQKYAAIVKSLYERTESDSLKWEMDIIEGTPATSLNNKRRIILSSYEYQNEPFEKITIRNKVTGGEVYITDGDFPRKYPCFPPFEAWYLAMKALREKAERKARGIDSIFDEVLDDLGATIDDLPDPEVST